jgi:phage tail-like protein
MADPARIYPFTAFNFRVHIRPDGQTKPLCDSAFAECDGLEMNMEVKTIRQGGDNRRQIRLAGPAGFGQLTLKRGMTSSLDLWQWFASCMDDPGLRATTEVVMLAANGDTQQMRFVLSRCLPVKLKAPPLNAREGVLAIEELQIAYETISLKEPTP